MPLTSEKAARCCGRPLALSRLKVNATSAEVIGVPSEKYGEEVMAWIKLRDGAAATSEELAAWCRGKIASYKIPRHWKFVDSFPMTVTGKVQKFKMREVAVEELGLEKAARVRTA